MKQYLFGLFVILSLCISTSWADENWECDAVEIPNMFQRTLTCNGVKSTMTDTGKINFSYDIEHKTAKSNLNPNGGALFDKTPKISGLEFIFITLSFEKGNIFYTLMGKTDEDRPSPKTPSWQIQFLRSLSNGDISESDRIPLKNCRKLEGPAPSPNSANKDCTVS